MGGVERDSRAPCLSHSNREMRCSSKIATSPSRIRVDSGKAPMTLASSPNRSTGSRPFRLSSCTCPSALRARILHPSYFSSYTHPSRWKGRAMRVGCMRVISEGITPQYIEVGERVRLNHLGLHHLAFNDAV